MTSSRRASSRACSDSACQEFSKFNIEYLEPQREHREHRETPSRELSEAIIGCAIRVHSELGPGLLESAYLSCLAHELTLGGIDFVREKSLPILYRGMALEGGYRLDLLVANQVVVELKAIDVLLPVHEAQVLTYLRLSGCRLGLLINFNVKMLRDGIRRLIL